MSVIAGLCPRSSVAPGAVAALQADAARLPPASARWIPRAAGAPDSLRAPGPSGAAGFLQIHPASDTFLVNRDTMARTVSNSQFPRKLLPFSFPLHILI